MLKEKDVKKSALVPNALFYSVGSLGLERQRCDLDLQRKKQEDK